MDVREAQEERAHRVPAENKDVRELSENADVSDHAALGENQVSRAKSFVHHRVRIVQVRLHPNAQVTTMNGHVPQVPNIQSAIPTSNHQITQRLPTMIINQTKTKIKIMKEITTMTITDQSQAHQAQVHRALQVHQAPQISQDTRNTENIRNTGTIVILVEKRDVIKLSCISSELTTLIKFIHSS